MPLFNAIHTTALLLSQQPLLLLLLLLLLFVAAGSLAAAEDAPPNWHSVTWENDFIADDDSGYTNGIGYTWGYHSFGDMQQAPIPNWLKPLAQRLPGANNKHKKHVISYRIAQTMYTPQDIEIEDLIPDDRPYAGILSWKAGSHHVDHQRSQRYGLILGIVGPAAGAEYVQNTIHQLIGVNEAKGWDNQLHNEIIFSLTTEQLFRPNWVRLGRKLELDWLLATSGELGTIRSSLGAGIGLRLGRGLADNFSGASMMPARNPNPMAAAHKREWYGYLNLYSSYVFNDITIDGNTFKDSHSVTLKNEQLFAVLGVNYNNESWGAAFSIQDGSDQFKERDENTLFASFSYFWRW